jgi:uncharacterized MAPEG superfamily protein
MTAPQLTLFAFALWTLLVPLGAVGVYRWSRILRGVQSIHTFDAEAAEGAAWYRRAMRAHMNCVENLPVFAVVAWALTLAGVASPVLPALCALFFACRVGQTLVHIGLEQTARTVSVRFSLFFAQVLCMLALSALVVEQLLA